jgi:hypothetical protein
LYLNNCYLLYDWIEANKIRKKLNFQVLFAGNLQIHDLFTFLLYVRYVSATIVGFPLELLVHQKNNRFMSNPGQQRYSNLMKQFAQTLYFWNLRL